MAAARVAKFTYPSYRNLETMLGRIDAIAAFSELSVRELIAKATDLEPSEYLRSLATRHHINLTHVDLRLLSLRTTQLHLVSVHQVFMEFLVRFKREHPSGSSWEPRESDEPMVQYVWRQVLGSKTAGGEEEKSEVALVEYYRFARNRFVHADEHKQPGLDKLKAMVKRHDALKKLDGPNAYRDLKFDDIIIFARSCLGVGNTICQNSMPTEQQVVSMIRDLDGKTEIGTPGFRLKGYRKFKNNSKRLRQALENLVHSLYGLEAAQSTKIVEQLACGLLA